MPCRPGFSPVAIVDHAGALFMLGTLSTIPEAAPSRSDDSTGSRPASASGSATDQVPPSQPTTRSRLMTRRGSLGDYHRVARTANVRASRIRDDRILWLLRIS